MQVGTAVGAGRDDAELAFPQTWLPRQEKGRDRQPPPERPGNAGIPAPKGSGEAEGVIGLFPRRKPMHVAIIDYGSGNLHSAAKAFERAARERRIGARHQGRPRRPEDVADADRIVLPGVGAFADCKRGLEEVPGMIDALEEAVQERGKPFLGICVGLQLMAERGLEHGVTPGLGWIKGEVRAIAPSDPDLKVPHMGWNTLRVVRAASHCSRASRPARVGCTLISSIPITSSRK